MQPSEHAMRLQSLFTAMHLPFLSRYEAPYAIRTHACSAVPCYHDPIATRLHFTITRLMWPFKKRTDGDLTKGEFIAIIIAVIALMFAIGTARWSWLLLDEQIQIRKDFMELKNQMDQTNINVDAWLDKIASDNASTTQ